MDIATPTADCLNLVHELLLPVVMKGNNKRTLSHQEVGFGFLLPGICDSIEWFLGILSLEDVLLSVLRKTGLPYTGDECVTDRDLI